MSRVAVREEARFLRQDVASEAVVLAVGDVFLLKARLDADIAGDSLTFADFADVTPQLMETLEPQVVVSSVFGRNFDCVDLAEKLSELGFEGCYRLMGHGMPQPDLVLREIRALFPSLRVELDGTRS